MEKIFFDSWDSLLRTFIITLLAYISLIAMLRISGKRTLTQMNAFDFIVTIALGSAFATVMLNKNVVLADGLLALLLLIGLQYLITKLSSRFPIVKNIITSSPTVLLYRGKIDHKALKEQRITVDELKEAIRKKGIQDVSKVGAVILETAGELIVMAEFDKDVQNVLHDNNINNS
jgi:uncharacterized membrane protein YcaP (DUF421 family)